MCGSSHHVVRTLGSWSLRRSGSIPLPLSAQLLRYSPVGHSFSGSLSFHSGLRSWDPRTGPHCTSWGHVPISCRMVHLAPTTTTRAPAGGEGGEGLGALTRPHGRGWERVGPPKTREAWSWEKGNVFSTWTRKGVAGQSLSCKWRTEGSSIGFGVESDMGP